MEQYQTIVAYQNQLFADFLEHSLLLNKHKIFKIQLLKFKETNAQQLSQASLLIVEADWPFPRLELTLEEISYFIGKEISTYLICNHINNSTLQLISKNKLHGIILKQSSMDEFMIGMQHILEGRTYFSSDVTTVLLKSNNEKPFLKVSNREKQILTLLADMNSTQEIAEKLSVSKSTVKTHRRNLMQKFNAKTTLCLLRMACRENLLNEDNHFCFCCYKQTKGV